jgi:hypothetical protein
MNAKPKEFCSVIESIKGMVPSIKEAFSKITDEIAQLQTSSQRANGTQPSQRHGLFNQD